ncbi:MAG: sodium:calcium antiporter [Candidatus Thorarchaeota archaeon]
MTSSTSTDTNDESHYRGVRESLRAGRIEIGIALFIVFAFFLSEFVHADPLVIISLGIIGGIWLAFRPSEWAVEGVESVAGHRGYTTYIAGLLSSLASNMPEAVVSGMTALDGFTQNRPELLTIAVLSVLIAGGFNMLLLGITIVISTRKKDDMKVPEEAIKKDSVLIRWTIVALACMFALGIVDVTFTDGTGSPLFPWEASLILFLSYILYSVDLMRGEEVENADRAKPHHSMRSASILCALGFLGIFLAGELLTSSVNVLLTTYDAQISSVANPITIAALILGAAGALPEHGIAIVAAMKGKVGIAVGNLIGGVLQILLLVMGGIGIFVPIPMNRYVLFQIVVIAGSLWFLKRAITDDHKLDTFEGMMIILLQAYVFALLIWGTPI